MVSNRNDDVVQTGQLAGPRRGRSLAEGQDAAGEWPGSYRFMPHPRAELTSNGAPGSAKPPRLWPCPRGTTSSRPSWTPPRPARIASARRSGRGRSIPLPAAGPLYGAITDVEDDAEAGTIEVLGATIRPSCQSGDTRSPAFYWSVCNEVGRGRRVGARPGDQEPQGSGDVPDQAAQGRGEIQITEEVSMDPAIQ
jgi:hypothetical protein